MYLLTLGALDIDTHTCALASASAVHIQSCYVTVTAADTMRWPDAGSANVISEWTTDNLQVARGGLEDGLDDSRMIEAILLLCALSLADSLSGVLT